MTGLSFTLDFLGVFLRILWLALPIIGALLLVMLTLGFYAGRHEKWSWSTSLYWTFITGLTVGYGDIRPATRLSRLLAVLIAWLGIMASGIVVAITVYAATEVLQQRKAVDQANMQRSVPATPSKAEYGNARCLLTKAWFRLPRFSAAPYYRLPVHSDRSG